jgi:hypothetical protein
VPSTSPVVAFSGQGFTASAQRARSGVRTHLTTSEVRGAIDVVAIVANLDAEALFAGDDSVELERRSVVLVHLKVKYLGGGGEGACVERRGVAPRR